MRFSVFWSRGIAFWYIWDDFRSEIQNLFLGRICSLLKIRVIGPLGTVSPFRFRSVAHLRLPLCFCAELADERGRNVELLCDVFHQPPRPLGGGDDLIHLGIAQALQVSLLAQSAGASVDLAQLSELAFAESVRVVSGDGPLQSSP